MERNTHTIDATEKVLGRLAAEIAVLLRGKHMPSFVPYLDNGDFVSVKNIRKLRISGKKLEKKKLFHHSGYLGGLKECALGKLFSQNPAEVLRRAVLGMLPKNKLQAKIIKRLKFE